MTGTAAGAIDFPTVTTLVERNARDFPNRLAFRFEERDTDWAMVAVEVERVAAALTADGIRAGDRIAYVGRNADRYFFLLYAAARIGAMTVPISWRLAVGEVRYIAQDTGARLLFCDIGSAALASAVKEAVPTIERLIAVEPADGLVDYDTWMRGGNGVDAPRFDEPDRVFLQLYTSGTTGNPKGVMLTGCNLFSSRLACAEAGVDWDQWHDDEVALIAMPVSHIGGTGYGLITLYHGATGVIAREFSPEGVLDAIRRERISKLFIVPTALQIMMGHPDARSTDYSRIRHVLYGASPMPLPLLKEAVQVMGAGLVQTYGMTETSGAIVALDASDHDPAGNERMKSAGRPLPGVEVRIVDDTGTVLPTREIGEIQVRSTSNMVGYWNLPDATAKTMDGDGWLRTGDAGYLDADGYLFICDRVKDMICSGGENVYPAEVEAALYAHPAIVEAAVIGVPDARWGEAVKAVVVPRPDHRPTGDELIAHCRTLIAGFKLPKSVDFADALPRNASGKVLKKDLRAPYWAEHERQVN